MFMSVWFLFTTWIDEKNNKTNKQKINKQLNKQINNQKIKKMTAIYQFFTLVGENKSLKEKNTPVTTAKLIIR